MLRVGIFYCTEDYGPIEPLQRCRGDLRDFGFETEFISRSKFSPTTKISSQTKFDLVLAQQSEFVRSEVDRANKIILLERADASISWCRKLIQDSRVLMVLKGGVLRDPNLNNHCYGRYHTSLLEGVSVEPARIVLNSQDLAKMTPGVGFGAYSVMDLAIAFSNWRVDDRRDIDVSFLGTINYGDRTEIDLHRQRAIKIVEGMSVKKLLGTGKSLKRAAYLQRMVESKIVISPWGFGELCYRDFEAFLTGAILVKPDTGFVRSWPDMFLDQTFYVPCRPDFSDLSDVISNILENYSKWDWIRYRAREVTLDHRNPGRIARYYAGLFRKVLDS